MHLIHTKTNPSLEGTILKDVRRIRSGETQVQGLVQSLTGSTHRKISSPCPALVFSPSLLPPMLILFVSMTVCNNWTPEPTPCLRHLLVAALNDQAF